MTAGQVDDQSQLHRYAHAVSLGIPGLHDVNKAWKKYKDAEYKFTKNPKVGFAIGTWCFLFTAFACILGMVPKVDYVTDPVAGNSLLTNILTPIVLISLGVILPILAKREKRQSLK